MVKKDFLFISRNKTPSKIDITPQKNKYENVPGKIFPKYIDEIKFNSKLDFSWTNTVVRMHSDQLFKANLLLSGEIQNFLIDCDNDHDFIDAIMTSIKIIENRKYYQSYETKHTFKLDNMIIAQLGFFGKKFIFDFAFLPLRIESLLNKKIHIINLTIKSLIIDRIRYTGNIDIDLSIHKIKIFEFRNEDDLRKIINLTHHYDHPVTLIDFSDWCLTPSETNCINPAKLASTDEPRTYDIVNQFKEINNKIISFKFFARIDQIDHLISMLPKCKLFYCLISNQDVRHSNTIKRDEFDEKQESIASFIENKYKDVNFIFRANRIYDKNEPPNYTPMDKVDSLEDVSIDEMNGTMYPELDDD